jgi:hypothetical protein
LLFRLGIVPINERLVDVWNARGRFVLVHRGLVWFGVPCLLATRAR